MDIPFNFDISLVGVGIAALEILAVLLFIVLIIKKSDAELKILRARSRERNKFIPPEPVFPSVTSVASNMVNPREINYTLFTGRPDYGMQGQPIFQQANVAAPAPFDSRTIYTEPPVNGYISDMAGEPSQYTGIPISEPSNYTNQGRSLFEAPELPPKRYETGLERIQEQIYSDFGRSKITDVISSADAAPSIGRNEEEKTTAHRLFDTTENKQ